MSEAATYLADPRNDDIPLIQDIKRWITGDLHKPLEEVAELGYDAPPVYLGADEKGWMRYAPGRVMTISVRFTGGHVAFKNVNLNGYSTERK